MVKSSLGRLPTSWPAGFLTVVTTRTRLTSTRISAGCAEAARKPPRRGLTRRSQRRTAVPFPFHPDFSVDKILLLPDGNQAFEAVNPLERGVESGLPVRRGCDDGHAGFANLHAAEPVDHRD